MARPAKDRPSLQGGYMQLRRCVFEDLPELSHEDLLLYLRMLALANWGSYGGLMGFPERPMSVRDFAVAFGMDAGQCHRALMRLRCVKREAPDGRVLGLVVRGPNSYGKLMWWLPHYALFVATNGE